MTEPMIRIRRTTISPQHKTAPGPRGHLLLGNARDIQRDPLRFGLAMTQQYGDIVRIRLLLARLPSKAPGCLWLADDRRYSHNAGSVARFCYA